MSSKQPITQASPQKIYRALFEYFGPQHWWPAQTPFEMIVGAILTQNTSWTNVERAITNLKEFNLLNVAAMTRASAKMIAQAIRPAGYFNVKADRLRHFLAFLNRHYGGRLERMLAKDAEALRAELLSIKGIGPETADSILLYAAGKPVFVVDAYARRIFGRLGLIENNDSYDMIARFFMDRLKSDTTVFNEYHALIVALAKLHCRCRPVCVNCPLVSGCVYGRSSAIQK